MSARRIGRPRSTRAMRSTTRTVVNGSRASPTVGGVIAGSGMPVGAGRNGPMPMVAEGASVTTGVISEWSTRDWRVYRIVVEPSPLAFPALNPLAASLVVPDERPSQSVRLPCGRASPPHEPDATDGYRPDPDPTDHRRGATRRDLGRSRVLPGVRVSGGGPRIPDGRHRRGR